MEPVINIFPSVVELTGHLVSGISRRLAKMPAGRFFSIALSGGSTPKAIFNLIAEKHRYTIDWSKVLIFWGDERCVPPTDNESNYRMAHENLFTHLPVPELNFCRIMGEENPEPEAARYSEKVDTMLPHKHALPQFDLILLGLGEDGHTASIFPYNIELFNSLKLFEVSGHPLTGQKRITATGRLINNAREVCFIVTGSGKAEKVAQILKKKAGWAGLPASLVDPSGGELVWLLDEAAGLEL
jgi:6-phosphogluconolactonase